MEIIDLKKKIDQEVKGSCVCIGNWGSGRAQGGEGLQITSAIVQ